jgi:hypothetical protein
VVALPTLHCGYESSRAYGFYTQLAAKKTQPVNTLQRLSFSGIRHKNSIKAGSIYRGLRDLAGTGIQVKAT